MSGYGLQDEMVVVSAAMCRDDRDVTFPPRTLKLSLSCRVYSFPPLVKKSRSICRASRAMFPLCKEFVTRDANCVRIYGEEVLQAWRQSRLLRHRESNSLDRTPAFHLSGFRTGRSGSTPLHFWVRCAPPISVIGDTVTDHLVH